MQRLPRPHRPRAVPFAAAVGGMVVPALIYFAINPGGGDSQGWAIPMATDIAFAVGIMAMLGKRVPLALKVFVIALAIVDDIGAVLVIAIFYTAEISTPALLGALALLAVAFGAGRLGIRSALVYAIIGFFMWNMLLTSGVHATIGGFTKSGAHRGYDLAECVNAIRSVGFVNTLAIDYRGRGDPAEHIEKARVVLQEAIDGDK